VQPVWELTDELEAALEFMWLLDVLSLANKVVVNDGTTKHIRWQQHAVLRAYELSLQPGAHT
jgi:hypothetical protein